MLAQKCEGFSTSTFEARGLVLSEQPGSNNKVEIGEDGVRTYHSGSNYGNIPDSLVVTVGFYGSESVPKMVSIRSE